MKILNILSEEITEDEKEMIELQSKKYETEVIQLGDKDVDYNELIEKIEKCDKVLSW